MDKSFFSLYDALLSDVDESLAVNAALSGEQWCLTATEAGMGIAMHTPGSSRPPMFPAGLEGLPLKTAAGADGLSPVPLLPE